MPQTPESDSDSDKTALVLELHHLLMDYAADEGREGVNGLRLLMVLSGAVVEGCFLFDQPNDALTAFWEKLAQKLRCLPAKDELPADFMPAPYILDCTSEEGRDVIRHMLGQYGGEAQGFAGMLVEVVAGHIRALSTIGAPVEEQFRILAEFTSRIMVLEVAAQELCDVLLDRKVALDQWSLGDCISSLSGLSGYKVAVWYQDMSGTPAMRARAQAQTFEAVVGVMTREAVRYGIPGGTDWRYGLPANDCPNDPPSTLISAILPFCEGFFKVVRAYDPIFQATACAKAAGRMLAVASGGEMPELAPAIAKPLAMAAMTESYRSLM